MASVTKFIRLNTFWLQKSFPGRGYIAVFEYCWVVNYYAQMETRMRDFLEENDNSIAAQKFVALMKKDILVYQRYKEFFGYVFFIGQKCDSKPMER